MSRFNYFFVIQAAFRLCASNALHIFRIFEHVVLSECLYMCNYSVWVGVRGVSRCKGVCVVGTSKCTMYVCPTRH